MQSNGRRCDSLTPPKPEWKRIAILYDISATGSMHSGQVQQALIQVTRPMDLQCQSRRAMGGARETEQLCFGGCHSVSQHCERAREKKKSRLLLRHSALAAPLTGYGLASRIILGLGKDTKN
ncbi:hypothetical protein M440DRAFT_81707 [Trichoderma longibrachiatum ATCC 18648]|uniref:Uncharacterized protein n=1 Tax=Trichoderma longibrachiatum ATCC 18648 TaxID=983965 RepID=A0A2T4CIB8_TRILO|nr:hypothetical protein M440DRAFT_81707 [Trichoderma longibrachiatum ATCC 18648]